MEQPNQPPHVLLLPLPLQSHVTPMLNLAQLLCHAGIHVTFLNTEHNHRRLNQNHALSAHFPTLRFESIPDGLPTDHPRIFPPIIDLVLSLRLVTKPLLRDLIISLTKKDDKSYDSTRPPLNCVITDGYMCFAVDVAEEVGIPVMAMPILSACGFWSISCIPDLIQQGQLPFGGEDMDKKVSGVPGIEAHLRRRDLPSLCKVPNLYDHPIFKFFMEETQSLTRVSALIINTFDDLEASILSHIVSRFAQVYTIGPLHALLKSRVGADLSSLADSLCQEERRCMAWLDSQCPGTVIFASFGSMVKLTRGQLVEFWHGLVNSGKQFLLAVRSDVLRDEQGELFIPTELEVGTKRRGFIVEWVPQEAVLAHKAVGGFLTHSGVNSTLEGIWAGVPMLCWPQLADQPVISRYVGEVWKVGIDMKDKCDRSTVEKMVRTLMEEGDQREQISKSVDKFAKLARHAVSEGGSSYQNLEKLIRDLRKL